MSLNDRSDIERVAIDRAIECQDAVRKAGRHVFAEFDQDDVEGVISTIASQDTCWVTFETVNDAGEERVNFRTMTTLEDARAYYGEWPETRHLQRVSHVRDLVTDWYMMSESVTEAYNPVTRVRVNQHHAVLFIMRSDGIAGEIIWPRWVSKWEESQHQRSRAENVPHKSDGRTLEERLSVSERFIVSLGTGDAKKISSLFRKQCYAAYPDDGSGERSMTVCVSSEHVRTYYEKLFKRWQVVDVGVANRIVDDWYTFAEVLIKARSPETGKLVAIRSAWIFGTDSSGRIVGQVGDLTRPISLENDNGSEIPYVRAAVVTAGVANAP